MMMIGLNPGPIYVYICVYMYIYVYTNQVIVDTLCIILYTVLLFLHVFLPNVSTMCIFFSNYGLRLENGFLTQTKKT